MVRIALDMDDVRARVLRTITETVDQDPACDRAVRAGVASLARMGQLEWPDRRGEGKPRCSKSQGPECRCGKTGAGDLQKAATGKLHSQTPSG